MAATQGGGDGLGAAAACPRLPVSRVSARCQPLTLSEQTKQLVLEDLALWMTLPPQQLAEQTAAELAVVNEATATGRTSVSAAPSVQLLPGFLACVVDAMHVQLP